MRLRSDFSAGWSIGWALRRRFSWKEEVGSTPAPAILRQGKINLKGFMKHIIICDIDGTIADCSHRKHFLEEEPKNWEGFFREDLVLQDKAIEATRHLLWMVCLSPDKYQILFITGRMEKHRAVTEKWLADKLWFLWMPAVYMRADCDFRPDYEVKEDYVTRLALARRTVFALEDTPAVVEMYRRHGIACWQVGEPQQWPTREEWAAGATI